MRVAICLVLMTVAAQAREAAPRRLPCALVRQIVQLLGEEGARALGKSYNMTPEEEEAGRKCLPREKPKEK